MRSVIAIILGLLVAGCGAPQERESEGPGKQSPGSSSLEDVRRKVAAVALCKTMEPELVSTFGESMRDGRVGKLRVRSWLFSKGEPQRLLIVALDERGTVVDISWDAPGAVMWTPRDQCAAPTSTSTSTPTSTPTPTPGP